MIVRYHISIENLNSFKDILKYEAYLCRKPLLNWRPILPSHVFGLNITKFGPERVSVRPTRQEASVEDHRAELENRRGQILEAQARYQLGHNLGFESKASSAVRTWLGYHRKIWIAYPERRATFLTTIPI